MGLRKLLGLKPKPCEVAIHDVRPLPRDEGDYVPYFAAICNCGWHETADTEDEARAVGEEHNPNVDPRLHRPVG